MNINNNFITVVYYSEHSPASMKLYNLIKSSNHFSDIKFVQCDNSNIRSRLLKNGIDELPVMFIMNSNTSIDFLIGKECFIFIDSIISKKLSEKQNNDNNKLFKQYDNTNLLRNNNNITQSFNEPHEMAEKFGAGKLGRSMNVQKNIGDKFKNDVDNMYDDTRRTIKNDDNLHPSYPNNQSQQQSIITNPSAQTTIPLSNAITDDDFTSTPPNIPSPVSSNLVNNNSSQKNVNSMYNNNNNNNNNNNDDDDDPSGMGIKERGGSPVAIAKMLEDSRGSIKIKKNDD